jgi:hypothetical protein
VTAPAAEPWLGIVAVGVLEVCVCVVAAPLWVLAALLVVVAVVVALELPLPPQPATSAAPAAAISNSEQIRRLIVDTPSGNRWTTVIDQFSRR